MNQDSQKQIYILLLQGSCFTGTSLHKQAKTLPETVGLPPMQWKQHTKAGKLKGSPFFSTAQPFGFPPPGHHF